MAARLVTLEQAVMKVVQKHGGIRAAERATGVDKSFISRLMRGQKVAPSADTLEALGLRAVPRYQVLKTPTVNMPESRMECSGDPTSCPENEGYGCCQPNPKPNVK